MNLGVGLLILLPIATFWIFTMYKWRKHQQFRKRVVQVEGTIVEKNKAGNHYYGMIEFSDQAGRMYQVKRTSNQSQKVGDILTIYYDPENPQDVILDIKILGLFVNNGLIFSSFVFGLSIVIVLMFLFS